MCRSGWPGPIASASTPCSRTRRVGGCGGVGSGKGGKGGGPGLARQDMDGMASPAHRQTPTKPRRQTPPLPCSPVGPLCPLQTGESSPYGPLATSRVSGARRRGPRRRLYRLFVGVCGPPAPTAHFSHLSLRRAWPREIALRWDAVRVWWQTWPGVVVWLSAQTAGTDPPRIPPPEGPFPSRGHLLGTEGPCMRVWGPLWACAMTRPKAMQGAEREHYPRHLQTRQNLT
jgi:hypothetical protein